MKASCGMTCHTWRLIDELNQTTNRPAYTTNAKIPIPTPTSGETRSSQWSSRWNRWNSAALMNTNNANTTSDSASGSSGMKLATTATNIINTQIIFFIWTPRLSVYQIDDGNWTINGKRETHQKFWWVSLFVQSLTSLCFLFVPYTTIDTEIITQINPPRPVVTIENWSSKKNLPIVKTVKNDQPRTFTLVFRTMMAPSFSHVHFKRNVNRITACMNENQTVSLQSDRYHVLKILTHPSSTSMVIS